MPPKKGTARVRSHTRRDGTKVRSHNRKAAWQQAKGAWVSAGVSGVTTTALILEMGLTILSTAALVITALLGLAAVWASQKSTQNKAKMRAATAARKKSTGRKGGRRPASGKRRSTGTKRRR